MLIKNMSINAFLLGTFALVGNMLLATTNHITAPIIKHQEREYLLKSLQIVIPKNYLDNDIFNDVIYVTHPNLLGTKKPVAVYRARKQNKPVAAIINSIAPNGYSGNIYLLVAINYDGTLAGIRITKHAETPGLGDSIDVRKTNWVHSFKGKSLQNTTNSQWAIKRDGGIFDEFTGASITPRAVVRAVKNTLLYYKQHRDELFIENKATLSNKHE